MKHQEETLLLWMCFRVIFFYQVFVYHESIFTVRFYLVSLTSTSSFEEVEWEFFAHLL